MTAHAIAPFAEWILFLALAAVALGAAATMVLTMSMYRAGLFLMVSFVAIAGLFFMLDAELLAVIQIMMNVGGMLVMILFMVMLMMDPGGEMMWDMKRQMHMRGPGALSMTMPRGQSADAHEGGATEHPMDMQPVAAEAQGQPAEEYTCPMHPEVRQRGPGKCPKCGMDLMPMGEGAGHGHEEHAGHAEHAGGASESMQMDAGAHHQMMVDMAMSTEQLPWALGLGALVAVALSALVLWTRWPAAPRAALGAVPDATTAVGSLLMSKYMMAFEGAAMLILAGIAGGVILGRRETSRTHGDGGADQ